MKQNIAILMILLTISSLSGCVDIVDSETGDALVEIEKPTFQKQPRIHLTHEYYTQGTNITTLQVSIDTLFFNNGMRTTDYSGFYIYEIPNESTPKYYIHTETVEYTVESVLIGDNTASSTNSVLHLFLPKHVMEKIVRHEINHTGLSGTISMVWAD